MSPDLGLNHNIIRHIFFSSQGPTTRSFAEFFIILKNSKNSKVGDGGTHWGGQQHSAVRKRGIRQYFFAEYGYLI